MRKLISGSISDQLAKPISDPISESISGQMFFEVSEVIETSEKEKKKFSGVNGHGAHDGVQENRPRLHLRAQMPSRHPLDTQGDVIVKNQCHHRIIRCFLTPEPSFQNDQTKSQRAARLGGE